MLVTLLRHAEIPSQYQGTYIGHLDVSLSSVGTTSAKKLATLLENQDFDTVFCSDLKRAKESLAFSKYASNALYTPLLREKSWGRHEGLSFNAIITLENTTYTDFRTWLDILDGENYTHFINRVKMFFLHFLVQSNSKNILVLTHAGVIRVLIMLVENISLEEAFSINIPYANSISLNLETMTIQR